MSVNGPVVGKSQADTWELQADGSSLVSDANDFLSACLARGLAPTSIRAYAFDLQALIRWMAGSNRRIEELDEADLLAFVKEQRDSNAAASSINRRLVTAGSFYQFQTGHVIPRSKRVSRPAPYYRGRGYDREFGMNYIGRAKYRALRVKTPRTLVEPLKKDQVNTFLMTCRRYRDLALTYLMLFCGLRSCEVLAIRISDVNTDNNDFLVRGKGNKQRILPLPPPVLKAMLGYLHIERPQCLTDRLFVVLQGRRCGFPMTPAGLRSLFRWRRRQASLSNANAHRFRHTFGTDMARAGVSLSILKDLMGHAETKTTSHYINLSLKDVAGEFQRASVRIRERYEEEQQ